MTDFEKVLVDGMGATVANTVEFVLHDLADAGVIPAGGPQTSAQAAIVLLGVMGMPAPGQTVDVVNFWRHAMLSDASTIKTTVNFKIKESCWNDTELMAELREVSPAFFLPLLDLLTGIVECHRSTEQVGTVGENKVLAFSLDHATRCARLDINLHASFDGGALLSRHEYMVRSDYDELVGAGEWPPQAANHIGVYTSVAAPGSIFLAIAAYLNEHSHEQPQHALTTPATPRHTEHTEH